MAKQLPTQSELVNYNYAVAGHAGTLSDVDGELFIKPCTSAEVSFYESSIASHPSFAEFMPVFLGTLILDQQTSDVNILAAGEALLAQHNHAVQLDPTGHEYHAHLAVSEHGTIVEDTSAHSCAHHSHSIENGAENGATVIAPVEQSILTPATGSKVVGKRISTNTAIVLENAAYGFKKPNILDVKLGVRLYADDASAEKKARFDKVSAETTHKELGFRIAGMRVWQGASSTPISRDDGGEREIDAEGFKIYDKNYGRVEVNTSNIVSAFKSFLFCEKAGVDKELGKLVAQAFLTDVQRIQEVLEGQESKMFSASLLFVFEGDGKALRAAMEEASSPPKPKLNGSGADEAESEDEEDTGPRIYAVKVIDFAHAQWVDGHGPDENSLKGVRSVASILKDICGV